MPDLEECLEDAAFFSQSPLSSSMCWNSPPMTPLSSLNQQDTPPCLFSTSNNHQKSSIENNNLTTNNRKINIALISQQQTLAAQNWGTDPHGTGISIASGAIFSHQNSVGLFNEVTTATLDEIKDWWNTCDYHND